MERFNGKIQCPECGSHSAVSKSVAWDAAAEIPAKTVKQLEFFEGVYGAAQNIDIIRGAERASELDVVCEIIPVELLDQLRKALGRTP